MTGLTLGDDFPPLKRVALLTFSGTENNHLKTFHLCQLKSRQGNLF